MVERCGWSVGALVNSHSLIVSACDKCRVVCRQVQSRSCLCRTIRGYVRPSRVLHTMHGGSLKAESYEKKGTSTQLFIQELMTQNCAEVDALCVQLWYSKLYPESSSSISDSSAVFCPSTRRNARFSSTKPKNRGET